jgi:hypothetical protein
VNNESAFKVDDWSDEVLLDFAYTASGDLCPMQAVIGGATAQEVMKVCRVDTLK